MPHKNKLRKYWIGLRRFFRTWKLGILYWENREPFRRESQITRGVMLLLFLFGVIPLWIRSKLYGTLSFAIYILLLGFVNYGLKKLSES